MADGLVAVKGNLVKVNVDFHHEKIVSSNKRT